MQAGIPRNQVSPIIRTNGFPIKVDTKKDATRRFEVFRGSVEENSRGGEVIECKEIAVEGKEIDNQVQGKMRVEGKDINQVQGKMRNSGRGHSG